MSLNSYFKITKSVCNIILFLMSQFIVVFTDFLDRDVFFNFYGDSEKNNIEVG